MYHQIERHRPILLGRKGCGTTGTQRVECKTCLGEAWPCFASRTIDMLTQARRWIVNGVDPIEVGVEAKQKMIDQIDEVLES